MNHDKEIEAARRDPNAFIEFALTDEKGAPYRQAPHHREWQQMFTECDRIALLGHAESGKALPLDTPIPTPGGFVRMGELRVGDVVFGRDGRPCNVIGAFDVQHGRDVYRVRFDDGAELLADAEHQWFARSIDDRANASGWRAGEPGRRRSRVVTTAQMLAAGVSRGGRWNWSLPLPEPVRYPSRSLPIDSYVLGAWLGDGDASNATLTFHVDDIEVYERCKAAEDACAPRPDKRSPTTQRAVIGPPHRTNRDGTSMRARLRALGLLGNKHVPVEYLTASIVQRRQLLSGLLDTDGHAARTKNRVEFCTTTRALADGVLELVRSLGIKATLREGRATLNGRDVGPKFRVCFTATEQVFLLRRKADRLRFDQPTNGTTRERSVVAIERVPSVPVRCIAVDSPDRLYLAGRDYVVTHNTSQVAFRLLWDLGHDPELRVTIVSAEKGAAAKILGVMRRAIEDNERVRLVFPELLPGKTWTSTALLVAGRKSTTTKDFSVQAYGWNSKFLGIRADRLIADDVNDGENSRSEEMRGQIVKTFDEKLQTRITAEGSVWVLGNAWHKEDLVHTVGAREAFAFRRYAVLKSDMRTPTWPEQFPLRRIAKLRKTMPGLSFARAYLCLPVDDSTQRFEEEWFERAKQRGAGLEYRPSRLPKMVDGEDWYCFTGVDLASGKRGRARGTDLSSLFTIAYNWRTEDRRILDIQYGQWKAPEIVARMRTLTELWDPVFAVEDNGTQQLFIDGDELVGMRVAGITTTNNKWDPVQGVEGMAITLHNSKWIIPCPAIVNADGEHEAHETIERWQHDLLGFTPAEHTSDIVMAGWISDTAARTMSRSYFSIERRVSR